MPSFFFVSSGHREEPRNQASRCVFMTDIIASFSVYENWRVASPGEEAACD